MKKTVQVMALVKNGEQFVFMYDEESYDALLKQIGRYAADPELSFSWYDAAILSQKVRKQREAIAQRDAEPETFERTEWRDAA
ncbi:hypothetical protein [Calycomorphotria hydatis]|uniref:Uncharacterized protein n=1 Tax=Calycomorphotria hydatis TaxID=2528027 RepID=A0A517TCA4_9PLAN|nr:hypothetical protein [Calycomorphotria hydatis]QDT65996.1 hypothetical protein V22_32600 [Calycomorphotria hydatis]